MKNFLLGFAALFILLSCNSEHETLVITFEEAHGLTEGKPVLLKGLQIGEITKVSLSKNYKIDVQIFLNDSVRLPNDSKFRVESVDLFNRGITVIPGKSKSFYKRSDKIVGEEPKAVEMDSVIQKFREDLLQSMKKKNESEH